MVYASLSPFFSYEIDLYHGCILVKLAKKRIEAIDVLDLEGTRLIYNFERFVNILII